ncbi:MAG TPA: methyltransferase domain-containing protein [Candidatus Eisenbacteria bacterium]|nr:methyltransferase domain-containing protein [Candidatus Eisenbacteria bacterium]
MSRRPDSTDHSAAPSEVAGYYARFPEESRLEAGPSRLEFERSKEILLRVLPKPPARVIDVGGAAGAYSAFLADRGYEVHLVDLSPRLVEEARRRNAGRARPIESLSVADARRLPQGDAWASAVLLMGPLYHLPERSDRLAALREAHRVLAEPGVVVAAAISRYASALDGMARKLSLDPRFVAIRDRDLVDGQHRNETGNEEYFTTAYFHRPEDLRAELEAAGFHDVSILGVEGPGWMVSDFDERWGDERLRSDLLNVARALEAEPSIVGVSSHLLGIGRKGR